MTEIATIRRYVKNARGAIESGQVVDKDVHGTLTKVIAMLDALAASNQEAWVAALLNAPNPEQALAATPAEPQGTWSDGGKVWTPDTPAVPVRLEAWIKENFAGHGRALRRENEPRLEGEPWMSMDDAKELTRQAVALFGRDATPAVGGDGLREALQDMLEFCQTQGDFKNGVTHNGIDEGEVWASGVFDRARAALAATPAVGGELTELSDRLDQRATVHEYAYNTGNGDTYRGDAKLMREASTALRAQPASPLPAVAELREQLHYMTGTCELAMKHRDTAEAKLAALSAAYPEDEPGYGGRYGLQRRQLGTATPAVGGEWEALAERIERNKPDRMVGEKATTFIYSEDINAIVTGLRLLALPASPLRGRDREQIAAILYMTRWSDQTWLKASLWETQLAYKQADAILSSAPPEQPDPVMGRDDVIAECAAIADQYDDCGGSFIAQKIRDLYSSAPEADDAS